MKRPSILIKPLPDAKMLRRYLFYDPDKGSVVWRQIRDGSESDFYVRFMAGCRADRYDVSGYGTISFFGESFRAHRIIWKLVHGVDPDGYIDHINGDRGDNRLVNLRDVSPAENAKNSVRGRWRKMVQQRRIAAREAQELERVERRKLKQEEDFQRFLELKAIFEPETVE
jgi:hypothetical protein